MILVAIPLPPEFSQTVKQVEASQQRYFELAHERRIVRRTYMGLLLLLTMIVLFVTTWIALFLSKLVTRPVAALAEATQEISRGRFDYRVDVSAADEIGDLVRSFNRMAEELESSRFQIEASSRDLSAANAELDQRRRQTVAILRYQGQQSGYVLVFEDLSDLLKAQKQAAWREVARRVAHEIKNPLTPIALSAERIQRHLDRATPNDPASLDVVRSCAETI